MKDSDYEGDYGCSQYTDLDVRCKRVASTVYREPFTPGRFAVIACAECGQDLRSEGFTFDPEATAQLCRDVEREEELELTR